MEDADFNYRDIFDQIRLGELRWGTRTFATPLGSPQLLLVYRADIFQRLGLKPPADWTEYQRIVERLADRSQLGDLTPPRGNHGDRASSRCLALPRGNCCSPGRCLTPCTANKSRPCSASTVMSPLIDQPPYVRALEENWSRQPSPPDMADRIVARWRASASRRTRCSYRLKKIRCIGAIGLPSCRCCDFRDGP